MQKSAKLQALIQPLITIILFFGRSYAPALVLSFLLKSKLWRPVRLLLVMFGEPLLRKVFGSIAWRFKKGSDETTAK
ncbi:phage shock protein D [Budviciaceae bacterium BWR-B9]|uniref:Phage shock protein D n=3 Tax=Limnobaculum TaxID=2172100 RepID=A0A9D7AHS4_9GAMM|nr:MULTISPECIES: phage shock protein D [Limnobaculum]MBK5072942.1 phage shock protein D [Limnobaculum xujianqingii]MBK5142369.1 phage shock protein D [Limnobaculum allomyrinae]MBK5176251.1 phage shock protein D [Limnobaculum xujianqingii]MBV7690746.1 phage shock protein D [Limnobaculum sp. M2-1]QBH96395.1 phage shock protein D [Limnobaculum zhutongyuii]